MSFLGWFWFFYFLFVLHIIYSVLFAWLLMFYWMPDIENFIVLDARHFYIPKNIFELCYEMCLSYPEIT